jgi:hypothetical protein
MHTTTSLPNFQSKDGSGSTFTTEFHLDLFPGIPCENGQQSTQQQRNQLHESLATPRKDMKMVHENEGKMVGTNNKTQVIPEPQNLDSRMCMNVDRESVAVSSPLRLENNTSTISVPTISSSNDATVSFKKLERDKLEMPPPPARPKKDLYVERKSEAHLQELNNPPSTEIDITRLEKELETQIDDLIITAQIAQNLQKKIECESKDNSAQHKKLRQQLSKNVESLLFELLLLPTVHELSEIQLQFAVEINYFIKMKEDTLPKLLGETSTKQIKKIVIFARN